MEAFFYVDEIPTKGTWVNMDTIESSQDVLEALAKAGVILRNSDGGPEYSGDLLAADYNGALVKAFLGSSGAFDLDAFIEARDFCNKYGRPHEAAAAYVENCGNWSEEGFYESYVGKYGSVADYAHEEAYEAGDLSKVPDYIQYHINWEGIARDMQYNGDIWTADAPDGDVFVFRNV